MPQGQFKTRKSGSQFVESRIKTATVAQLRAWAKNHGVKTAGSREELVERMLRLAKAQTNRAAGAPKDKPSKPRKSRTKVKPAPKTVEDSMLTALASLSTYEEAEVVEQAPQPVKGRHKMGEAEVKAVIVDLMGQGITTKTGLLKAFRKAGHSCRAKRFNEIFESVKAAG